MVSPINSGFAQQVPASNTFQPGGNAGQVQNREQQNDEEQVRSVGTSTAQSQQTETRNNGTEENNNPALQSASSRENTNSLQQQSNQPRGSTLDITV